MAALLQPTLKLILNVPLILYCIGFFNKMEFTWRFNTINLKYILLPFRIFWHSLTLVYLVGGRYLWLMKLVFPTTIILMLAKVTVSARWDSSLETPKSNHGNRTRVGLLNEPKLSYIVSILTLWPMKENFQKTSFNLSII